MEEKKLIFLDIDGVLAGEKFAEKNPRQGYIDPKKIKLVNQLEGAEIVISSSWGYDNGLTEKALRACGLKLPIIGYTKRPNIDWCCRGNEIEHWLYDNAGWGTKYGGSTHESWQKFGYEYVIIDDQADMLLGQKDHFVHVDHRIGLTQENTDKAKQILKL